MGRIEESENLARLQQQRDDLLDEARALADEEKNPVLQQLLLKQVDALRISLDDNIERFKREFGLA